MKQNLCHEECLDAASNLEKQILDLAKSNVGYKAQIIKRRKEIETETKNFALHESFKVQKQAEIALSGADFFQKASDIIAESPIYDISPTKKKILQFEPVEKPKKKQSTLSGLKKLKKRGTETPKKISKNSENSEKLSNSELSLLDKYLNKAKIKTTPEKEKSPEKLPDMSIEHENTTSTIENNIIKSQEESELENSEKDNALVSGQRETNNAAEVAKFIIPNNLKSFIKPSILNSKKGVDTARQNRLMRLKRQRSPDPSDVRLVDNHMGGGVDRGTFLYDS